MKKIIIAILALTITFGLLGIGTYGVFAKPEDTNIIDHGKLSLSVLGKTNTANEAYFFENIKPGDSGGWVNVQNLFDEMSWTVQNTGKLDGTLEVSIEGIVDTGAELSTQIRPQMRADGVPVKESSNLRNLPTYQRDLASGKEVTIDIAWKFYETTGNEYQGASTKLNVKFYISAPSPDTPIITPITPTVTTSLDVAGITEPSIKVEGISVLGFTGLNPMIPIAGFSILLLGFIFLIIEAARKRKAR